MKLPAISSVGFAVALLLSGPAPRALAADAALRTFNLPSADATVSLQQFSDQSGEQIVYPVDAVRGVTTNAVVGRYRSRDALEQMLAGTELSVFQDGETGALTVKRRTALAAVPSDKPADPPAAAPSPQASTTAGSSAQVVKLETFVVTGTNLPTPADTADVPVTLVGSQDMDKIGENANMLDILRKEIPAFAGRSNIGTANATNSNQVTAGGSQIQLRNLDTLVLINGRRVAVSGANAANGGKNFVDVNQIPKAAIDHIEVLSDGASAIYGSDAVGGVVNIILKSDYNGSEIGGRYAISPNDGHYSEKSGYLIVGAGHRGVNLTVTGSWSKTDPLWQSERPFIKNNVQLKGSYPGVVGSAASGYYVLSPGVSSPSMKNPVGASATATSMAALAANGTYTAVSGTPAFNLAPDQTVLMNNDQKAATVDLSASIVPARLSFFGDFMLSETKSAEQTNAFLNNLSTVTVPAGSPFDPLTTDVPNVVVGNLNTPLKITNHAHGARGEGGFKGQINSDWNWEIGGVYSQEELTQDYVNELFAPNLAAAIAGGYNSSGVATSGGTYSKVIQLQGYPGATAYVYQPALDPFADANVNPASLANVYGTEVIKAKSVLKGEDAKLVGKIIDLPAGKWGIAAGGAYRIESLSGTPDSNSYNLSTSPGNHNWGGGGVFFDPFSHSRTITSWWSETRVPVTSPSWNAPGLHALDLSLAGRIEKYDDTGTSDVPKIGLRWQPFDDQVTFRYTYSKAFTAPDLWHEYGPPSVTAASSATFFATNIGNGDPRLNQTFSYFSGNGNNPDLKPTHAWSRSYGLVIAPKALKGFILNLNYVDVFEKGLPAGIGASNIVSSVNALGSASPYFSAIAVGGIPGTPGASQTQLASPNGLYNLLVGGTYQGNIYIADHFVNSGGLHVEALDINPEYELRTENLGAFTFATTGSYLDHFLFAALPTQPFYEFAGYSTNTQTEAGTFPHWSFYTTVDWQYHGWDATIGNTYMSSTTDIGPVTNGRPYAPANYLLNHPAVTVNAYYSWDLSLSYTFDRAGARRLWSWLKGMTISAGVNDVFNRYGPYAGLSQAAKNNYNNVDTATYSPIGRLLYTSASIKF